MMESTSEQTVAISGSDERLLTVSVSGRKVREGEPLRQGIPFAKGELRDFCGVLVQAGERGLSSQGKVLATWPDESVKWLLVDWVGVEGCHEYKLQALEKTGPRKLEQSAASELSRHAVSMARDQGRVTVTQGEDAFVFGPEYFPCQSSCGAFVSAQIEIALASGESFIGKTTNTQVIDEGPARIAVRTHAKLQSGRERLECELEVHFFAGSSLQRWTVTIRNPCAAAHPGGIWELGDANSIQLKHVQLRFRSAKPVQTVRWRTEFGDAWQTASSMSIYQASSGGKNWDSLNHVDRTGKVNLPFRGYRLEVDGKPAATEANHDNGNFRACPTVVVNDENAAFGVALPRFWQDFPKRITSTEDGICVQLLPACEYAHEIQGGEQKSHSFWVASGDDTEPGGLLEGMQCPPICQVSPDDYAIADVLPRLTPQSEESNENYLSCIQQAVEGENSFEAKREIIDQYGWRHFGDVWGDHEAAFSDAQPLISHWNNQYDLVYGLGIHYLRSNDVRWFRLMDEMSAHVRDIDIYHTDEDKSGYNHGLFWHTVHYIDAGKANHRSYPAGSVGGGPCSEHAYARGFLLHHYLTGEQTSLDAVVELGDWVLAMEEGHRTVFRYLSAESTGLSSASGTPHYHGPGRGPGNASETLLTAFEATGNRKYLERVELLMHRVVHPEQDLERLNLLDAERRWYYTLYLQSLGRYLEMKAGLGELDEHYHYGRECLMHYARWMANHEYPYLEKPEILEYPTETWAAQDMRKFEVFQLASHHADDKERVLFRERAEFFFNYSTNTLIDSPTGHYCRPIALLLSNGYSHQWFVDNPDHQLPPSKQQNKDWAQPEAFVPQKQLAIKRAKIIAAVGMAISVVASCALIAQFL